jgi:hypothetical protein
MDTLIDDPLDIILSYLDSDSFQISSQVCKRWHKRTWLIRNKRGLKIYSRQFKQALSHHMPTNVWSQTKLKLVTTIGDNALYYLPQFTSLQKLKIQNGLFHELFVSYILDIPTLRTLKLENLHLSVDVHCLTKLTTLKTLSYEIDDSDPDEVFNCIAKIPSIKNLTLEEVRRTTPEWDVLTSLTNLKHLNLTDCNLHDMEVVKHLPKLSSLHIQFFFDEIIPPTIPPLPKLTELHALHYLEDKEFVSSLQSLKSLTANLLTNIDTSVISLLPHPEKLEYIELQGISDPEEVLALEKLKPFHKCINVRHLKLVAITFPLHGVDFLKSCTKLETLTLTCCRGFKKREVKRLVKSHPKFKTLAIKK